MSNPLDTLYQQVKNNISSTAQRLFGQASNFVQQNPTPVSFINNSIPGGIQGGIQRVGQSFQQPQNYNLFSQPAFQQPIKSAFQSLGNTVQSAVKLTPAYDLSQRISGINPTPQYIPNAINTGMNALNTAWKFNPESPVYGAGFGALQGIRKGMAPLKVIKNSQQGLVNQPFIGEALSDNPTTQNILNLGFMGAQFLHGGLKVRQEKLNAISQNVKDASIVKDAPIISDLMQKAQTGFRTNEGIDNQGIKEFTRAYEFYTGKKIKGDFQDMAKELQDVLIKAQQKQAGINYDKFVTENGGMVNQLYGGQNATGFKNEGSFSSLADKKTRFEIDDSGAKLKPFDEVLKAKSVPTGKISVTKLRNEYQKIYAVNPFDRRLGEILKQIEGANSGTVTSAKPVVFLQDVLDHPNLYKEYPSLRGIVVEKKSLNGSNAQITKNASGQFVVQIDSKLTDNSDIKSTLLHEIQHAIQEKEGFARGGSLGTGIDDNARKKVNEILNQLKKYEGKDTTTQLTGKEVADKNWLEYQLKQIYGGSLNKDRLFENYQRLAGEVEARDVQSRMNLTPEQRASTLPYNSQNIPVKDQIVRFDGGTAALNPEAKTWLKEAEDIINKLKTNDIYAGDIAMDRAYRARGVFIPKDLSSQTISGLRDIGDSIQAEPSLLPEIKNMILSLPEDKKGIILDYLKSHNSNLDWNANPNVMLSTSKPSTGGVIPQVPPEPVQSPTTAGKARFKEPVQPRGFTQSVQESGNVPKRVKSMVQTVYEPKPENKLMGEAQALLQQGASLDIKNIKNVDQKVAATIQYAVNNQKKNPQLAADLYNNLSEVGTQLGRGVKAFDLLNKMSPEAIALSAAGKIKKYNETAIRKIPELTGDQVSMIAQKVQDLSGLKVGSREHNIAVNELSNMINNFIPSSLADKAITVWKAGLLTSLRTHERNLFGNTIMNLSEIAKDIPASLMDRMMQASTGKRTLTATTRGLGQGIAKGSQAMKDIALLGYDPQETISKFDVHQVNFGEGRVGKALKFITDLVYRPLAGEDKPFWHASYARSLYDQAGAMAINEGKQGNRAFIENLVKNPTEEMAKTALNDANYATFHDKNVLTGVANSIKKAAQNEKLGPVGSEVGKIATEMLAPFTGVPSSIVGKTIAYSPIGLIKGAINAGRVMVGSVPELQRQAAQEIGRGVLGSGLFGLGAYLMSRGLMTGQPKDTKEAQLWQAQNKPSNSVLINGKWRSINSIGPQNLVILAGAKYNEEMGKNGKQDIGAYLGNLGKDQLNQTFLQGMMGPLNALTDPARYGTSYLGNTASSFVPNGVKDIAKSLDPTARELNTPLDYVKSGIPIVRNSMIPKRDVLGNVIPQEPTGWNALFDLFNSKTPKDNAVLSELDRLSQTGNPATPSKMTQNQTILKQKVKLTFDQLNNLEAGVGQALRPQLQSLVTSPSYATLDDEQKAQAIQKIITDTRKQVKNLNSDVINTGTGQMKQPDNVVIVNKNGNVKVIDVNSQPVKPQLIGFPELDKKAISTYNGEITSKINDLYDLYVAGKITANDANSQIASLKSKQIKSGVRLKPTLKSSKIKKMTAIKLPKLKKLKAVKLPKIKLLAKKKISIAPLRG